MQPGSLSDEQLRSLAKEIRDGVTATETDWLEWKRALDLTTAAARFEVSRQILGMANRVPGLARRNCGGYGYLLVGVEQFPALGSSGTLTRSRRISQRCRAHSAKAGGL